MDLDIKLPYTIDYKSAEASMRKSLSGMQEILPHPAPYIGINLMEGDGYHINVYAWTAPENFNEKRLAVQAKLLSHLKSDGLKWPGMP